jgi:hypothetical protein
MFHDQWDEQLSKAPNFGPNHSICQSFDWTESQANLPDSSTDFLQAHSTLCSDYIGQALPESMLFDKLSSSSQIAEIYLMFMF